MTKYQVIPWPSQGTYQINNHILMQEIYVKPLGYPLLVVKLLSNKHVIKIILKEKQLDNNANTQTKTQTQRSILVVGLGHVLICMTKRALKYLDLNKLS